MKKPINAELNSLESRLLALGRGTPTQELRQEVLSNLSQAYAQERLSLQLSLGAAAMALLAFAMVLQRPGSNTTRKEPQLELSSIPRIELDPRLGFGPNESNRQWLLAVGRANLPLVAPPLQGSHQLLQLHR